MQPDTAVATERDRRGERIQPVLVVVVVGERDQTLVPAPVVPVEPALGEPRGDALVEDALELFERIVVGCVVITSAALEERRGGQLLGVSNHDRTLPAS